MRTSQRACANKIWFYYSMRCFSYPVTISFCLGTEKRQDPVKEEKMKNFLTLCVFSLAGAALLCFAQEEQDISVRWDPRSKIFAVRVEFVRHVASLS